MSAAELSPAREPSRPTTAAPLPTSARLIAVGGGCHEARDLLAERRQPHVVDVLVAQRLLDGAQPARRGQPVPLAGEPQHERAAGPADRAQRDARAQLAGPPGGWRASSRAPADSAVVPSTEANTSEVCVTLPTSVRASSTSAPVPEPLSFGARARRQVVAAGDEDERVARAPLAADDAEHVDHRHACARWRRARGSAACVTVGAGGAQALGDPVGRRGVARAARRAVGEALTSSFVAASACAPSNVGGSELRGSAGAVRAPTSSTNAGTSTTSQPVR